MKKDSREGDIKWIEGYYNRLLNAMSNSDELTDNLLEFKEIILKVKDNNNKIIFAGNGASNTIGNHGSLDFMGQLGIPTININDGGYLTAAANDFGYDNVFKRTIDISGKKGDLLVLISSSGRSPNVINAAKGALSKGMDVVTFSGFKSDNPLRELGSVNFYVDSDEYNIVESIHNAWLVSTVDLIIKDMNVGIHGIEFDVKGIDNNDIDI